jgi:hypothetical protein
MPSKTEETEKNGSYIGTLKSKGVGQKLITILWIGLALLGLSLILSLLEVIVPSIYYDNFELIDGLIVLLILPIALIGAILFLIWVYRLHFDLSNVFLDYPISPFGSLARLIIPIYNIWGIWDTFATIADHFKKNTEPIFSKHATIIDAGISLRSWLPFLYIAIVVSKIMSKIAFRAATCGDCDAASFLPILLLAEVISSIFVCVVYLQMTRAIFSGMNDLTSKGQGLSDHDSRGDNLY